MSSSLRLGRRLATYRCAALVGVPTLPVVSRRAVWADIDLVIRFQDNLVIRTRQACEVTHVRRCRVRLRGATGRSARKGRSAMSAKMVFLIYEPATRGAVEPHGNKCPALLADADFQAERR